MRQAKNIFLSTFILILVSCSRPGDITNPPPPPPPPPPNPTPTTPIGWWKLNSASAGTFPSPKIYFGNDGFHYQQFGTFGNRVGTWATRTNDSINFIITAGFGAPLNSTIKVQLPNNSLLELSQGSTYVSYTKLDSAAIDSKAISSVAGTGTSGFSGDGGPATAAQIQAGAFCIDASNNIYLLAGNRIRKITAATGIITTIAGTGVAGNTGNGGLAINANIEGWSLTIDAGSNLYIGDNTNKCIRKINAASGIINQIVGTGSSGYSGDGGPAINAQIASAESLRIDAAGNLYFIDALNKRVRKIAAATGIITTVAGNGVYGVGGDGGPALSAQIYETAMAIDQLGNIYLGGQNFYRLRKITASSGIINTLAGTGVRGYSGEALPALSNQLSDIGSIYVDAAGNIFFTEMSDPRVRKLATDGKIYTVAGTGYTGDAGDGPHATAYDLGIGGLSTILLDSQGNIIFSANLRIRKVNGN